MHKVLLGILGLMFLTLPASAQTADQIIANYQKGIGGADKLKAIKTMRMTGKMNVGGGLELAMVIENKRPNLVRTDILVQGLNGVNAYDGKTGWKVTPWEGKKDAETVSEDELKQLIEQADMDSPLVNYQQKGHKVELLGKEDVEGTETYKLKVLLKDGNTNVYYLDADSYLPIKVESKQIVRGAEVETESTVGDYKQVNGVYMPYSIVSGAKGSQDKAKITIQKIEVNVPIEDSRFAMPAAASKQQPAKTPEDMTVPKKTQPNPNKPAAQTPAASKPPIS